MADLLGQGSLELAKTDDVIRTSRSSPFRHHVLSFRGVSTANLTRENEMDDVNLLNAAIETPPAVTVPDDHQRDGVVNGGSREFGGETAASMDAKPARLNRMERHTFIENLIKNVEEDNRALLEKQRDRLHRVGVEFPRIEVRYKNLCVDATCEVVNGKPLPTLWNTTKAAFLGFGKIFGLKPQEAKISILRDVSGIIKPGRMTLLLGPPGSGKTTLLSALAGKLKPPYEVRGDITYNGSTLEEFVPEKTSAYISQHDLHIPEMTVRETLDFSARCQGVGRRADIIEEVRTREKLVGLVPDTQIDTYMKEIAVKGLKRGLQTDYILKTIGMDKCADTMVGDAMRRGISGGQKKRLTIGEMIVGPARTLFMDEISTGLDSSTTFQIVKCLQQLAHITEATMVASLLQPAPETYELFDEVILMAEGKSVYHGPRTHILNFFEECGFRCPERKGEADFLQEVISKKDQQQYWNHSDQPYSYVSVDHFSEKFKACSVGQSLHEEISEPYDRSKCHKDVLSFNKYSLTKWELLKACMARELLLMRRNSFIYIFKTTQLIITAFITITVFYRSRMLFDVLHANYYMSSLFYSLIFLMVNGYPELAMTVSRLPVFYKQRDLFFYPGWAYAIPASILKIPISLIESFIWITLTYYVIGYSPNVGRFFRQFLLLFAVHQMSLSWFRFLTSYFQTIVPALMFSFATFLVMLLFGGFILPRPSLPSWLRWGSWLSPITYSEIGMSVNEFLATRWQKMSEGNTTVGQQVLMSRGLNYGDHLYWISVGVLFGITLLLNVGVTLALTFLRSPRMSRDIISRDMLSELQVRENHIDTTNLKEYSSTVSPKDTTKHKQTVAGRMVLPFNPLTVTFQDVQYYVDTPPEMREHGYTEKRLQLLQDITGAFRPGILTALMGVSGAGKTTLMDVLSGRKTGGTIEGDIRIGGYLKVQETFARISGYCEQSDIHSPQITVEESVMFSAWLRLSPQINPKTRAEFVDDVLETIELDGIKDALVGIPGVNGLSTEQRKRLTIAVELVSNPSIMFMDEPTSGLDARAAAIVMRAVKNVAETGRTVVCTVHQPCIDIFEAFDELILMKMGGKLIYSGPLGQHSNRVIEYFEGISGVTKIQGNFNPATWMLEVTSTSVEVQLGVDFAQLYTDSPLYKNNLDLVKQLSMPPPESKDLHFSTRFPQKNWCQFKACLWKQYLSYWRNPAYNLSRFFCVLVLSATFALVFWQHGKKLNNQQDMFNMFGSLYIAIILLGMNNCTTVIPLIERERIVLCREKFAGMYSSWAYSFAQMTIEIPYILLQAILFLIITYPTVGYYWSAYKVFWYFYVMFCTLLYTTYLGMLLVSLTPNGRVAAVLASTFNTLMFIFSGFIIPGPQIPKWWIWLYYIVPTSWSLNGLFTSQYGDINKEIIIFGETKTISSFIHDYFGFHHDHLAVVAVVLIAYPLIFGSLFAYCIGKLNFQRR